MKRKASGIDKVFLYLFLYLVLLFMLVPFLWLIVSSFRPNADLFTDPFGIPQSISLDNYKAVLKSQPMLRYFLNTAAIALIATILSIAAAVMASFAMMYRFRLKNKLGMMFYIGLFIPTNAFMVPYYVMINRIGLYDTIPGIALVYAGVNIPISILVIKGFMDSLPRELLEAAKIDGATVHQSFLRVVLPMTKPGIVTACVFVVLNSWNELLFANLLNQSEASRTIQVAIRSFLTTFEANYAYAFAAMVLSILPTILIYILLTDKIIDGMTAGAVKG